MQVVETDQKAIEDSKQFAYNKDPYNVEGRKLWAQRDISVKELFEFIEGL